MVISPLSLYSFSLPRSLDMANVLSAFCSTCGWRCELSWAHIQGSRSAFAKLQQIIKVCVEIDKFSVSTITIGANSTIGAVNIMFHNRILFVDETKVNASKDRISMWEGRICLATRCTAPQVENRLSRTLTSRVGIRLELRQYILGARRPLAPVVAIGTFYCFPTQL